jgi:hypothetical protein
VISWIILWNVGFTGPSENALKDYNNAIAAKLKNEALPKGISTQDGINVVTIRDENEKLYIYEYNIETAKYSIKKNYPYVAIVNFIGGFFYAATGYYVCKMLIKMFASVKNFTKRLLKSNS